jgi:hypothetical protein
MHKEFLAVGLFMRLSMRRAWPSCGFFGLVQANARSHAPREPLSFRHPENKTESFLKEILAQTRMNQIVSTKRRFAKRLVLPTAIVCLRPAGREGLTGRSGKIETRIRVSGGDEVTEYVALLEWLTGERCLAGHARLIRVAPCEGQLGGVFDMLAVALGSGGALAVLADRLSVWIKSRQAHVSIIIEGLSGRVILTSDGPADILPLLQEIMREPHEPEPE